MTFLYFLKYFLNLENAGIPKLSGVVFSSSFQGIKRGPSLQSKLFFNAVIRDPLASLYPFS